LIAPTLEYKNKIIEIIGPPGIGKSTLYLALRKKWNPKKNWIYEDILLAPDKPKLWNPFQWLEYNFRWYTGKNLNKTLAVDLGMKFIRNNEPLAAFCWKYFTENPHHNSTENRFRYSYFLYQDFCGFQAVAEKKSPKPCLIEEGFFQKSFLIHQNFQLMEEILDKYLSLIPLPRAVIGLDSENVELILSRIKERKKVIPSHFNKDEASLEMDIRKWQHLVQLIMDKLEKKKVLVYKIDGSKSVDEKVAIIEPILNSLNT